MEENTKKKIIRVGFHLMKEKGYDNVTINEICQAVNISKHTFYYYFNSKEDILKDFMQIPAELKQEFMASIISMDSPLEQYLAVLTPKIQYIENCGVEIVKKFLLANLTTGFHDDPHPDKKHPLLDLETSLLKKAQSRGEIRNMAEPDKLVQICFVTMVGMAQVWATTDAHFPLKENYLEMVKIILNTADH